MMIHTSLGHNTPRGIGRISCLAEDLQIFVPKVQMNVISQLMQWQLAGRSLRLCIKQVD
jgi:hypothetical protein